MFLDAKTCYGAALMTLMRIAGKDAAKKFDTWFRFHKRVNLKHPESLRDKVMYIENHCPSPLAVRCTDKWDVRSYVAEKGLADMLVPVYGTVYRAFDEIPFDRFPDQFVLKATHGCKMNYYCTSKAALDLADCRKTLTKWLHTTYGTYSGEWHYLEIPHRIYCEQYLDDAERMVDYKFHCMNGVPWFVLVCSGRKSHGNKAMEVTLDLFDMDWKPLPGLVSSGLERAGSGDVPRPKGFESMVCVAQKLSEDIPFVRVDLYELKGKIYFGELTFSPACGVFPYFSDTFLQKMGKELVL